MGGVIFQSHLIIMELRKTISEIFLNSVKYRFVNEWGIYAPLLDDVVKYAPVVRQGGYIRTTF